MKKRTPFFDSSDLSTILHSKRANLYYLEYCRVLVNGGRVEYVTDAGKESLYYNIPDRRLRKITSRPTSKTSSSPPDRRLRTILERLLLCI